MLHLKDLLDERDIFCRLVRMDVASHTPEVDGILADLASAIADITPAPAAIPMRSTVTRLAVAGEELDAAYWALNLRTMVAFEPVISDLLSEGYGAFVEIGPAATLVGALGQIARVTEIPATVVASMRRNEDSATSLLGGLAALYTRGFDIDWRAVYPLGPSGARLPSYPWQHQRFWIDEVTQPTVTSRPDGTGFLGRRIPLALKGHTEVWHSELSLERFPLLADHRVNGRAVFPAGGYLDMAAALAETAFGDDAFAIEDVDFDRILTIPDTGSIELQTLVTHEGAEAIRFEMHTLETTAGGSTLHCRGVLRRVSATPPPVIAVPPAGDLQLLLSGEEHRAVSVVGGFDFGPAFDFVDRIEVAPDGYAYARLRPLAPGWEDRFGFAVDPGLLDCCFQTAWYGLPIERRHDGELHFPVHMQHMRVHGPVPRSGHITILIQERPIVIEGSATYVLDELLLDDSGKVFIEMRGATVQAIVPEPESPLADLRVRRYVGSISRTG